MYKVIKWGKTVQKKSLWRRFSGVSQAVVKGWLTSTTTSEENSFVKVCC